MGEAVLNIQSERSYWFVAKGDSLVGPLLSSQVLEQLRYAELGPSDFCWKDGFTEWRPLASVSEFGVECANKTFSIVLYPKLAIPNQKGTDNGKRRRASDGMTMLSLAPDHRKVVQVNFAKTRVRRLSIYEWAFAMMFTLVCTYVGAKLTVDSILARMDQLHQSQEVAGDLQILGGTDTDRYVFDDFAAQPLLSAPSWGQLDHQVFSGQAGVLERPVMTFVAYKSRDFIGSKTWTLDPAIKANVWNPESHELDPVYQRPIQATVLVPETNSSHVNLVLKGEPYLY